MGEEILMDSQEAQKESISRRPLKRKEEEGAVVNYERERERERERENANIDL